MAYNAFCASSSREKSTNAQLIWEFIRTCVKHVVVSLPSEFTELINFFDVQDGSVRCYELSDHILRHLVREITQEQ